MFVEPGDFATVAELALAISGCSLVAIRLANPETGEMRLALFPEISGVNDLPAGLVARRPGVVTAGLQGLDDPALKQEIVAAGLPELAFWAGFSLKSQEGRRLGLLVVMDGQSRDLSDAVLAQLRQLAEILSRGIGMAASTIRTMARQSLGLIEDLAELEETAASPALRGLLRYAAGREPVPGDVLAMRRAGLAEERDGLVLLTPMARDILYVHGFRLANPRGKAVEGTQGI